MLRKALIERLKELRNSYEIDKVCFFNDGKVREDEKFSSSRMNLLNSASSYNDIEDDLYRATKSYSNSYEFDSIDMHLLLGLVYDKCDVDENNHIKKDAEPKNGIVRYYTGSFDSYLDGKQTNDMDYSRYGCTTQGYIRFDYLVSSIRKSGLEYTGPETFAEFKERILSGEVFDIKASANLKEDVKKLEKRI